jgi:hypothetical protein
MRNDVKLMKKCVIEDKFCIECGNCNICDLDENKICDNCGKCIEPQDEYATIYIDEIIIDNKDK